MEARVPMSTYSAKSRSSRARNRVSALAARTSPRAPNWPRKTRVRVIARSSTPITMPRDSSDAGTVMPPLPGDSPTGTKSRTRRISTAPPAQAYQYPAANSARRPQNMPARVEWATSRVSHAITTATTRAPASSSRARPGVVHPARRHGVNPTPTAKASSTTAGIGFIARAAPERPCHPRPRGAKPCDGARERWRWAQPSTA